MNKASGGDGILIELFQILKDDAVKVLHSICQQMATGLEKGQFSFQSQRKAMPKNAQTTEHNCIHVTCQQSNAQNSPSRLQQYMNHELPDVQAGFRKSRGTRDQIANIRWIIKKAREFQKTSALLNMPKTLTLWITTNCGKFLKRWEYQTT